VFIGMAEVRQEEKKDGPSAVYRNFSPKGPQFGEMASDGHSLWQAPQSMQVSGLML
jgi:hypothetical protein